LPRNQEIFWPLIVGNPLKRLDSKEQMQIKASKTKARESKKEGQRKLIKQINFVVYAPCLGDGCPGPGSLSDQPASAKNAPAHQSAQTLGEA
jgi:hypothetical protein